MRTTLALSATELIAGIKLRDELPTDFSFIACLASFKMTFVICIDWIIVFFFLNCRPRLVKIFIWYCISICFDDTSFYLGTFTIHLLLILFINYWSLFKLYFNNACNFILYCIIMQIWQFLLFYVINLILEMDYIIFC